MQQKQEDTWSKNDVVDEVNGLMQPSLKYVLIASFNDKCLKCNNALK